MTSRDSGQDFDPKHRIVGAVVVVVLAVIFIPMVLGERAPPAAEPPLTAGPAAGAENKVAVTKVSRPAPAGAASPAVATDSSPSAPAKEAAPPVAPPKASSAKATTAAKRPAGGWVVQVGTFSNVGNADRLERKLRAGGQPVLAERIDFEGGKAVRLRIGPFQDRAAALQARERIQKDVGVQGVVLAYP